jgi:hypothetical protein
LPSFVYHLHCLCQNIKGYKSLDVKQQLFLQVLTVYKGDTITLGLKAFFIDGQRTDEDVAKRNFVFNSITALKTFQ